MFTWTLSEISSGRSGRRAVCQFYVQHLREQQGGQGHRPHWQKSSFLVSLIFWQGHSTTCQTKCVGPSSWYTNSSVSLPNLTHPTATQWRICCLRRPMPSEPLLLPEAQSGLLAPFTQRPPIYQRQLLPPVESPSRVTTKGFRPAEPSESSDHHHSNWPQIPFIQCPLGCSPEPLPVSNSPRIPSLRRLARQSTADTGHPLTSEFQITNK